VGLVLHGRPEGEGRRAPAAFQEIDAGGAFRIHDLQPGEWVLRVMRQTPEGLRWGLREFRREEGPVDLGVVEASGWAGLRFRVLDGEGRPVPGAPVVLTFAGGPNFLQDAIFQDMERTGPRGGSVTLRADTLFIQPGEEARDPEGWYEIPDLAPGTRYRLQDAGTPKTFAEATTPAENGGWAEVELRRGK